MSSWRHGVTRYQWLVLFVAWLGWVFDAMDATIYAIVLYPALHELLGVNGAGASAQDIGWYGGIIFSIFLIGWAVGGIVFAELRHLDDALRAVLGRAGKSSASQICPTLATARNESGVCVRSKHSSR